MLILDRHFRCSYFAGVLMTKLECTIDWAPLQIPTLTFLTHPAPPSPTPGAWTQQQNENYVQYIFYLLFVRTHTKFGIKILELTWKSKFNYIWPHPKVTILTLGWKFYLHSVRLVIPVNLMCHIRMFGKNDPLGTPCAPKSNPGASPRRQNENLVW